MPKFYVKTTVDYFAEVEADNAEEAEQMGWDFDEMIYDGVYDITVEELDEEDEEEDA